LIQLDRAPAIEPEPTAGVAAADASGQDLRDHREKAQLVTPTMWR
jgi:hypothetical protein